MADKELMNFLERKANGEEMSIVNVKNGAAVELIDLEIQRILDNIDDPNTTQSERTLTFKLKFRPNEDRNVVEIAMSAESKLSGPASHTFAAAIHTNDRGRPYAEEINRQRPMFPNNVTNLERGKK